MHEYTDDDDDEESVSSGDEAMMAMEESAAPTVQVECSICYDRLTEQNRSAPPCGNPRHTVCHECLTRHATNWSCHCVSAHSRSSAARTRGAPTPAWPRTFASSADRERLVGRIQHFQTRQGPRSPPQVQRRDARGGDGREGPVPWDGGGGVRRVRAPMLLPLPERRSPRPRRRVLSASAARSTARRARGTQPAVPKKGHGPDSPELRTDGMDCVAHLRWLVSGENHTLPNRCRACDCPMHRTAAARRWSAACASARCGMSGLEFETHLIDHWHGEGRFGTCPRWPTDVFWDHTVTAQERCEEGVCHDEYRDCTDPAHKDYREQVVEVRRMRHARCCLASFPHELQRLVLRAIAAEGGKVKEMVDRLRFARQVGALV